GYKVVVTGEGSDELFAGYPFFKRDLILQASPPEVRDRYLDEIRANNAVFEGSILSEVTTSHPAFDAKMGFTPSWIQPWISALARVRPLLSREYQAQLEGYD